MHLWSSSHSRLEGGAFRFSCGIAINGAIHNNGTMQNIRETVKDAGICELTRDGAQMW